MQQQESVLAVRLPGQPMDCACHPIDPNIFATSLISGRVQIFRSPDLLTSPPTSPAISLRAHAESCRGIAFANQGQVLLTASTDRSYLAIDVETGKPLARKRDAHGVALSRIIGLTGSTFCSGDDGGVLKVWDMRQSEATCTVQAHTDFVSDMCVDGRHQCLLSVSADGALSVLDLRTGKVLAKAEGDPDDELLSVACIKHSTRVVTGSQTGNMSIFTWDKFEECSDRITGCPSSVDALIKYDEDTLMSGSEDGLIRLVNVQPHNVFGLLARETDTPVERLALTQDARAVISAAHENALQIHGLGFLCEGGSSGEEEEVEGEEHQRPPAPQAKRAHKSKGVSKVGKSHQKSTANMFSDLL